MVIAIVLIQMLAGKLKVAYPILLVVAGLCISFIPGLPALHISPDLIFFIFLPPLLFESGEPVDGLHTPSRRPQSADGVTRLAFTRVQTRRPGRVRQGGAGWNAGTCRIDQVLIKGVTILYRGRCSRESAPERSSLPLIVPKPAQTSPDQLKLARTRPSRPAGL